MARLCAAGYVNVMMLFSCSVVANVVGVATGGGEGGGAFALLLNGSFIGVAGLEDAVKWEEGKLGNAVSLIPPIMRLPLKSIKI